MTTNDSHLAKMASNEAKSAELPEVYEATTDTYVVSVRNEVPALGLARCVTLSANNPYLEVIPRDPKRRNAFIWAVDNDVYICSSREVAAQVAGSSTSGLAAYLPKQMIVLLDSRAPYWVACTTTNSVSRVSILVNQDE